MQTTTKLRMDIINSNNNKNETDIINTTNKKTEMDIINTRQRRTRKQNEKLNQKWNQNI